MQTLMENNDVIVEFPEGSCITLQHGPYTITTDKKLLRIDDVHQWLSEKSYWAKHIPYEVVKTAFDHSYCIGALIDGRQVAFARLVTDYSVFAYLADVYVAEEHRGKGISKRMIDILFDQEWTKRLRRIMLATVDAHGLYALSGFAAPKFPDRLMEIIRPGIYGDANNPCK